MTTTATDQIAVDLLAAAEVLRTRGWTTGKLEGAFGCVCLVGAIRIAVAGHSGKDRWIDPALFARIDLVTAAVEDHLNREADWMTAETWNDKHCESGDEAAELLERVAAERGETP